jgi:hypothetical protein
VKTLFEPPNKNFVGCSILSCEMFLLCSIVMICSGLYCPFLHCSTLPPSINTCSGNDNNNNNNNNNKNAIITSCREINFYREDYIFSFRP